MKILLISAGKKHDPAIAEAVSDFTSRLGHYAPAEWKLISGGRDVDEEGKAILSSLNQRDYVVLLDDKGKEVDSSGLAQFLEKRLNAGEHQLVFIIGGAYGVNEEVRNRAQAVISLSKLTFPHQIARLVLVEQLYRAFTILRGEKYHHA